MFRQFGGQQAVDDRPEQICEHPVTEFSQMSGSVVPTSTTFLMRQSTQAWQGIKDVAGRRGLQLGKAGPVGPGVAFTHDEV